MEVRFTADSVFTKITGQTTDRPFLTPYSSREYKSVKVTFYGGCDLAKPLVDGSSSISAFQAQVIQE